MVVDSFRFQIDDFPEEKHLISIAELSSSVTDKCSGVHGLDLLVSVGMVSYILPQLVLTKYIWAIADNGH